MGQGKGDDSRATLSTPSAAVRVDRHLLHFSENDRNSNGRRGAILLFDIITSNRPLFDRLLREFIGMVLLQNSIGRSQAAEVGAHSP